MCGILFLLDIFDKTDINGVSKAFDLIKYRGPDNTTLIEEKGINSYFGHHRLSIINPNDSENNQPFDICSENGNRYILLVNGEIYNYLDIFKKYNVDQSNNDCKAVLSSYLRTGDCDLSNMYQELDGDFAYIIYDELAQRVYYGRDHIGLKPLYIGRDSNNYITGICSEAKVLESFEFIKTIEAVKPSSGGFIDLFNKQDFKINYSLKYGSDDSDSETESTLVPEENIKTLLTKSVVKRIQHTHRPLAILCSGGVDSSIILGIAVKEFPDRKFHAFSIEFDGRGISYDTIHAKMVIDEYPNVEHTIVKFTEAQGIAAITEVIKLFESYDINTLRAGIPMYLLAKYIKEHTDYKVILSGEGADELFLGYEHFTKLIGRYTLIEAKTESIRLLNNLYSFDILRAERSFSTNGLELRVPFLDSEFVQYVKLLDSKHLIPINGVEKHTLRKSFEDLGLPDRVLYRQKERFSDGIGYGWVPILINYCKDKGGEKGYYKEIYNKFYSFDTLLIREMPDWCKVEETDMIN